MIQIGGRVGFDKIEELEKHFKSIDFPIELALPWRYDLWLLIENKIDRIRDDIRELSKYFATGEIPKLLPFSEQFKNTPEYYGYKMDGTS